MLATTRIMEEVPILTSRGSAQVDFTPRRAAPPETSMRAILAC